MNLAQASSETPLDDRAQKNSMPSSGNFEQAVLLPAWRSPTDNDLPSATDARALGGIEKRIIPPVITPPFPRSSQGIFAALQTWEGVVTDVGSETFVARLVDESGTAEDEDVELPLDEVSRPDISLVSPGAIFYWGIGYLDRPSGERRRQSVIRFRRLPAWSPRELENARLEAWRLLEILEHSD